MKKILNYILVTAILGTFLPYSALAETTNVGVNITGSVSIDVVTTISTNITLDLTTGETTPTYMEIKNNSLVPVNVSITDISASQGAPNQFVKQTDKDWNNLNRDDTEYYVNFNILGEGQNVSPKDILADTHLYLGILDSKSLAGKDCSLATEFCHDSIESDTKIFEINANFGKNWSSGDKNFTYQITTVYSQAKQYADPTLSYTYPTFGDTINYIKLVDVTNDLSKFNFTNPDISSLDGYYYVFAIDYSVVVGLGMTFLESKIVLYEKTSGYTNAIRRFGNISEGIPPINYVATETNNENIGYLFVPVAEGDISTSGTSYNKLVIDIKQFEDLGGESYGFSSCGEEYNYTYIIKTVNM